MSTSTRGRRLREMRRTAPERVRNRDRLSNRPDAEKKHHEIMPGRLAGQATARRPAVFYGSARAEGPAVTEYSTGGWVMAADDDGGRDTSGEPGPPTAS